jgi:hypothetical protein
VLGARWNLGAFGPLDSWKSAFLSQWRARGEEPDWDEDKVRRSDRILTSEDHAEGEFQSVLFSSEGLLVL